MTAEIFIVDDNADIRNILNDLITDAIILLVLLQILIIFKRNR